MSPPAAEPPPAARAEKIRHLGFGALLVAAVVAAYAGTLSHGFIWDDDLHVYANPRIIGPDGLVEIWTTAAANYFPLVLTNFWVQHALWGLNPLGYHAVTIGCHALCALLLWRVLVTLRVPGAWLGAALWALHPVQVESVAWISELKNTQSGIFFLLSIWFWLKWLGSARSRERERVDDPPLAHARSYQSYFLSLACAVLALLSKPSTVMLPVVLALLTWWQRGELRGRDLVRLAPFLALSAAVSGWTIWEQRIHSGAVGAEWSHGLAERVAIAGKTTWFYLGKLVWPHPLSFIYPRWEIAARPLDLLPAAAALAGLAFLWWPFRQAQGPEPVEGRRAQLRPHFAAAVYFVALLFPVLGFFDVYFFRYSFVGDHFQYLASMGPPALLATGLAALPRRIFAVAAGALLLGFGGLTWRQSATYRDNISLWRATVDRNPAAVMAWLNLGDSLSRAKRYPESIAAYREALRRRPTDADGHNDLGCVLTLVGEPGAAIRELEQAIALRPDLAAAYNNLGNALREAGRRTDAMARYTEAIRLKPDYVEARNNLGAELAETGRLPEAIAEFDAALRLKPADVPTRANLARALRSHGIALVTAERWREAIAQLQRSIAIEPGAVAAHASLAVALVNSDRVEEAVPVFRAALRLDPAAAGLHDQFGQVLAKLGRNREALEHLEEAARLRRR